MKTKELFNVEEHWQNPLDREEATFVATIEYGKPYALAKSIKRLEELKSKRKGTFHVLRSQMRKQVQDFLMAYYGCNSNYSGKERILYVKGPSAEEAIIAARSKYNPNFRLEAQ